MRNSEEVLRCWLKCSTANGPQLLTSFILFSLPTRVFSLYSAILLSTCFQFLNPHDSDLCGPSLLYINIINFLFLHNDIAPNLPAWNNTQWSSHDCHGAHLVVFSALGAHTAATGASALGALPSQVWLGKSLLLSSCLLEELISLPVTGLRTSVFFSWLLVEGHLSSVPHGPSRRAARFFKASKREGSSRGG